MFIRKNSIRCSSLFSDYYFDPSSFFLSVVYCVKILSHISPIFSFYIIYLINLCNKIKINQRAIEFHTQSLQQTTPTWKHYSVLTKEFLTVIIPTNASWIWCFLIDLRTKKLGAIGQGKEGGLIALIRYFVAYWRVSSLFSIIKLIIKFFQIDLEFTKCSCKNSQQPLHGLLIFHLICKSFQLCQPCNCTSSTKEQ